GPKISATRPRGSPPTPRAISSPSDPVEIAGISTGASAPPSFMMAPFPYCFSIWDRARSSARFLSSFSAMGAPLCDREIGGDYTQVEREKPSEECPNEVTSVWRTGCKPVYSGDFLDQKRR